MDRLLRRFHDRAKVVSFKGETAPADDLAIARRRMRHLAPWHIEPLPAMHAAIGRPTERLSVEQYEQSERIALQLLAIQMALANTQSAMH